MSTRAIVRALRPNEVDEALGLIEAGFSLDGDGVTHRPDIGRWHHVLFSALYRRVNLNPDWIWVAEVDSRLVGLAAVLPRQFHLGVASVPGATLTPVATLPEYRRQGLGAACVEDCLTYLRRSGLPLVYLIGHPHYYPRFGFAPVFPTYRTIFSSEQATRLSSSLTVRNYAPPDFESIRALYERTAGRLWFRGERGGPQWRWQWEFPPIGEGPSWLVAENENRIAGYAVAERRGNELAVVECDVDSAAATSALLIALRGLAAKHGVSTIVLDGPITLPAVSHAHDFGAEHHVLPPAAQMLRVLDGGALSRALIPAFRERLRGAEQAGQSARLDIRTEAGECAVHWDGEDIEIEDMARSLAFELPLPALTELVVGCRSVSGVAAVHGLHVSEDAESFLSALFPKGAPFLLERDAFF